LKTFFEKNPINQETQIKLEEFLASQALKYPRQESKDIGGIFNGLYSKNVSKFLLKYEVDVIKKINTFLKKKIKQPDSDKGKIIISLIDIIHTIGKPYLLSVLLGRFIKILSNSRDNIKLEKNLVLQTSIDIAKDIINEYLRYKYNEHRKSLTNSTDGEVSNNYTFTD